MIYKTVSKLIDACIIGGVCALIALAIFRPYDATDDADTRTRSGMYLYTDHGTGCQYLRAGVFSALVPRLNRHGDHVCDRYE